MERFINPVSMFSILMPTSLREQLLARKRSAAEQRLPGQCFFLIMNSSRKGKRERYRLAREVPAQLYLYILRAVEAEGRDVESALSGLDLRHVDSSTDGERIDWDELALFLDRAYEGATDEELMAAGRRHANMNEWMQLLARISLTPRLLNLLDFEVTRYAYPHCSLEYDLISEPVTLEMRLPRHYRGCRTMWLGSVGGLETMNVLVGYPPARVEYDVGTHHGSYRIWIGEEARLRDRFAAEGRRMLDKASQHLVSLLERSARADRHAPAEVPSVLLLQRELGFTRAESRVVHRLVLGMGLREISDDLGISYHTVKAHLRSLFTKTGARSQAALVSYVLLREADHPAATG